MDIEVLYDDISLVRGGNEYCSNPRGYFTVRRSGEDQVEYSVDVFAVFPPFRRIPQNMEDPEDVLAFLTREEPILALGDSFTMGQGVRYEDTYSARLERLIAKEGTHIGIKNTGGAGYDIEEVCLAYDAYSADEDCPLVIYGFVLNDFGLPGKENIVGSDYIDTSSGGIEYSPWRRRCAAVNFVYEAIDRIRLDRTTRRSYLEAFRGENAIEKFDLVRSLNREIELKDGKLVIVLFPLLYEFHHYPFQEIHDKIRNFCRKEGILLLDLLPAFSKHKAPSLWVHPSDHHPNEIAHRIAAEEIHAFLKRHGLLEALAVEEP
jgi:hypothetical protein